MQPLVRFTNVTCSVLMNWWLLIETDMKGVCTYYVEVHMVWQLILVFWMTLCSLRRQVLYLMKIVCNVLEKSVLSNWKLCREIKEGIVLVVQWYWFMDLVNDEMFPELCVKCQKLCVNVNRWKTNIICKRARHQCCSPRNLVNFLGEHAATMLFVFLVHRDLADLARRYMHTYGMESFWIIIRLVVSFKLDIKISGCFQSFMWNGVYYMPCTYSKVGFSQSHPQRHLAHMLSLSGIFMWYASNAFNKCVWFIFRFWP